MEENVLVEIWEDKGNVRFLLAIYTSEYSNIPTAFTHAKLLFPQRKGLKRIYYEIL